MTTVMVGIVGGPRPKRLVGQQALGTARPADLAFLCSCAALKVCGKRPYACDKRPMSAQARPPPLADAGVARINSLQTPRNPCHH